MDKEHYDGMRWAKRRNYEQIYKKDTVTGVLDETVKPMMQNMYSKLLKDLKDGVKSSPIYRHHIDFILQNKYVTTNYLDTEPNQIIVDYMASMTDDYCTELYGYMFPDKPIDFHYHGYFEDLPL